MSEQTVKTLSVSVKDGVVTAAGRKLAAYKLNDKARVEEITLDADVLLETVGTEAFDGFLLYAAQEWVRFKSNNNPTDGVESKLKSVLATLAGYWKAPSAETQRKRQDELINEIKAANSKGDKTLVATLKAELFELLSLGDIE